MLHVTIEYSPVSAGGHRYRMLAEMLRYQFPSESQVRITGLHSDSLRHPQQFQVRLNNKLVHEGYVDSLPKLQKLCDLIKQEQLLILAQST